MLTTRICGTPHNGWRGEFRGGIRSDRMTPIERQLDHRTQDTDDCFACLILEDDPVCAKVVEKIVSGRGGEPVVCANLAEARELVARAQPDLLILDHELPDGTGTDFFLSCGGRMSSPRPSC